MSAYRRGLQAIANRTKLVHAPLFFVSVRDVSRFEMRMEPGQIIEAPHAQLITPAMPMLAFLRPACLGSWRRP